MATLQELWMCMNGTLRIIAGSLNLRRELRVWNPPGQLWGSCSGDLRVSCAARTEEEVREKCGRLTWHCRQRASNKVDVRQILTSVRVRPAPGLIERHSLTFVMPFNKKRLYRDTRAGYFELRWQFCTSLQRQPLPEVKFCWCWDWKWSKVSDDLEYRQVNGLKQRHN